MPRVSLALGCCPLKKLFDAWVEKPVYALSGCPASPWHKDVVPDAVDTNGDVIPDSSSGVTQGPDTPKPL